MADRKFILELKRAPGDVSLLTALVRDIKLTYGDRYLVDVRTNFPAFWRHNPYLTPLDHKDPGVEYLLFKGDVETWGQAKSKRGTKLHYLTLWHREFTKRTKIQVPVLFPKPDFHLTDVEKSEPLISGRYWIVVAGGKEDMTIKLWYDHRYQELVDRGRELGLNFVQEGATKKLCLHKPLENVLSCVGKTSIRDLMVNIYHAEGIICGITMPMHVAGGLEKPCVVVGGGREEPWWEAYCDDYQGFGPDAAPTKVPHRFLHTLGLLKCCENRGCWERSVVPVTNPGRNAWNKKLCQKPNREIALQVVPECMAMIQTDHVLEAVMSYYEDGTLEPIGKPKGTYAPVIPAKAIESGDIYVPKAQRETVVLPPPDFVRKTELEQEATKKAQRVDIAPVAELPPLPQQSDLKGLDHPSMGGKVTICVLLYGEYHNLHRRCLDSIVKTVPRSRMDLRVATNQVCDETMRYLEALPVTKIYTDNKQRRKYPAMRTMFNDPEHPIDTKWLIWFDDDSYVRNHKWLTLLADTITAQLPTEKVGMLGVKLRHDLRINAARDPRKWFAEAPWYQGKHWRNTAGSPAPNGHSIHFVVGGFWALRTDAMRTCQIPDARLNHNGGDVCIGEQLYQGGFKMKMFNIDKVFIHTSAHERRGFHEKFLWYR